MKVSVLDLGFNSVKLVNYHVKYDGSYKAYQNESMKVKLGLDLAKTGAISNKSTDRTIDSLRLFRDIIDFQGDIILINKFVGYLRSLREDRMRTEQQLHSHVWVCYRCSLTFETFYLASLHANLYGHKIREQKQAIT